MSEEEFDELLDLMSENNLTQHGADTLYGEIVDREIKRKRLNNIINEFDKWLENEIKFQEIVENAHFLRKARIKLQELKGSE